nr:MAG TPA: hypothetical protein [Caudoviricetes sp.]
MNITFQNSRNIRKVDFCEYFIEKDRQKGR